MNPAQRQSTGAGIAAFIIFAGFVFSLTVNLPGHLSYDSIVELLEGRSGEYSGWHPPVTSWLLGLSDALLPGAAFFVLLDMLLLFGSLWLLVRRIAVPAWAASLLFIALMLTPQFLLYPGIVWKDVLFAAAGVFAFAAIARASDVWADRRARYVWLVVAFILLVLTALVRQNGILMLLGGIGAYIWIAARRDGANLRAMAVRGGGILLAAIVLITAANVALGTRLVRESGFTRQIRLLEAYDIIAALAVEPGLKLGVLDKSDPMLAAAMRGDGVRLYTPRRNDPLFNSAALQIPLQNVVPGQLRAQWFDILLHHPGLYLANRATMFAWVLFTPRIDLCVPFIVGVSGPSYEMDELDLNERLDGRDQWLQRYNARLESTPVFQHGLYGLLSLIAAVLLLRRRRDADIAIGMMQVTALVFTLSFFVISLACDYRYLYVLDISAAVGWYYLALEWPGLEQMWRWLRAAHEPRA